MYVFFLCMEYLLIFKYNLPCKNKRNSLKIVIEGEPAPTCQEYADFFLDNLKKTDASVDVLQEQKRTIQRMQYTSFVHNFSTNFYD